MRLTTFLKLLCLLPLGFLFTLAPLSNPAPVTKRRLTKTITFDGSAGNGAAGTVLVATITGRVKVRVFPPFCSADLTVSGAATIQLGCSADPDAFVASTTASGIDNTYWWGTNTPAPGIYTVLEVDTGGYATDQGEKMLSSNIILTIASANVTGGTLVIDIEWEPITADGNLA